MELTAASAVVGDVAIAVPAAIASAVCFAMASVLQHRAVLTEPRTVGLRPGLLLRMLTRGMWLVGSVFDVVGVGLQSVALRYGPVSLVQPLLVLGLPFAALVTALFPRPHLREAWPNVLAALGCAGAVAILVLSLQPREGPVSLGGGGYAVLAVITAVALGLVGRGRATVVISFGAGALLGVSTVGLRLLAAGVGVDPLPSLIPAAVVVVVAGGAALIANQAAMQRVPLALPLSILSIVEPLIAIVLAVTVLREQVGVHGIGWLGLVVGSLGAAGSIVFLAGREEPPPERAAQASGAEPDPVPPPDDPIVR